MGEGWGDSGPKTCVGSRANQTCGVKGVGPGWRAPGGGGRGCVDGDARSREPGREMPRVPLTTCVPLTTSALGDGEGREGHSGRGDGVADGGKTAPSDCEGGGRRVPSSTWGPKRGPSACGRRWNPLPSPGTRAGEGRGQRRKGAAGRDPREGGGDRPPVRWGCCRPAGRGARKVGGGREACGPRTWWGRAAGLRGDRRGQEGPGGGEETRVSLPRAAERMHWARCHTAAQGPRGAQRPGVCRVARRPAAPAGLSEACPGTGPSGGLVGTGGPAPRGSARRGHSAGE